MVWTDHGTDQRLRGPGFYVQGPNVPRADCATAEAAGNHGKQTVQEAGEVKYRKRTRGRAGGFSGFPGGSITVRQQHLQEKFDCRVPRYTVGESTWIQAGMH